VQSLAHFIIFRRCVFGMSYSRQVVVYFFVYVLVFLNAYASTCFRNKWQPFRVIVFPATIILQCELHSAYETRIFRMTSTHVQPHGYRPAGAYCYPSATSVSFCQSSFHQYCILFLFLFQPTNIQICIYITTVSLYIKYTPTCFGISVSSSGSFTLCLAILHKFLKLKLLKTSWGWRRDVETCRSVNYVKRFCCDIHFCISWFK